jgi:hypothetical protein
MFELTPMFILLAGLTEIEKWKNRKIEKSKNRIEISENRKFESKNRKIDPPKLASFQLPASMLQASPAKIEKLTRVLQDPVFHMTPCSPRPLKELFFKIQPRVRQDPVFDKTPCSTRPHVLEDPWKNCF